MFVICEYVLEIYVETNFVLELHIFIRNIVKAVFCYSCLPFRQLQLCSCESDKKFYFFRRDFQKEQYLFQELNTTNNCGETEVKIKIFNIKKGFSRLLFPFLMLQFSLRDTDK